MSNSHQDESTEKTIESDDSKIQVRIDNEYYRREGIVDTMDNYIISIVHPKYGSCTATIILDENDSLQMVDAPEWMDQAMVEKIVESLHKNKS